jgi:hypothetical protein
MSPSEPTRSAQGNWHANDRGEADDSAIERTLIAYGAAGGTGRLRDELSFGMYIAGRLNFLHGQAVLALDPGTASEDRELACSEIVDVLGRLPVPSLLSHLVGLASAITG